jgi:hypothetical protein
MISTASSIRRAEEMAGVVQAGFLPRVNGFQGNLYHYSQSLHQEWAGFAMTAPDVAHLQRSAQICNDQTVQASNSLPPALEKPHWTCAYLSTQKRRFSQL